jgi:hypothetical protein
LVTASIFWGNQQPEIGACATSFVDTEPPTGTMNVNPLFVSAAKGDFRLQSTSPLIDQVPFGIVDHGFFGTHGPLGLGWDIGAHECR